MEAQAWLGEILARMEEEEEDVSMVMEVDQAERLFPKDNENRSFTCAYQPGVSEVGRIAEASPNAY